LLCDFYWLALAASFITWVRRMAHNLARLQFPAIHL
jgi:hypothetical protein